MPPPDDKAPGKTRSRQATDDAAAPSAAARSAAARNADASSEAAAPAATEDEPSAAPRAHPKDPLHGVTLQQILEELHAKYGWERLGSFVQIRCFTHDPSMGSSLAFLRRTPWARSEVEALYVRSKRGAGSPR